MIVTTNETHVVRYQEERNGGAQSVTNKARMSVLTTLGEAGVNRTASDGHLSTAAV